MLLNLLLFILGYVQLGSGQGSCPSNTQCTAFSQCPSFIDVSLRSTCNIRGQAGMCCPSRSQSPIPSFPSRVQSHSLRARSRQRLDSRIQQAFQSAFSSEQGGIRNMLALESQLYNDGLFIQRGTPPSKHLSLFPSDASFQDKGRTILATVMAAKAVQNQPGFSSEFSLAQMEAQFSQLCPALPVCDYDYKYRNFDGTCNNPNEPLLGMSGATFVRLAPPAYEDGFLEPRRKGRRGNTLEGPRKISNSMAPDVDRPLRGISLMVMQWGQFLDHDFTRTPVFRGFDGKGIACCNKGKHMDSSQRHPQCLPIDISSNDPFFKKFNQRCMEFVRSLPALPRDCGIRHVEQFSSLTHFLDGSVVYGSNITEANDLREHRGGRLKISKIHGHDYLPIIKEPPEECFDRPPGVECFQAGDGRANEQIELTVMHTLWMREHNRVADLLSVHNPSWNDETLYQEARRIVSAEIQHITYNEWLPVVLGREFMKQYNMEAKPYWYSYDYSPEIDATISSEFATAAFRFGHTLLQGSLELHSDKGRVGKTDLHDNFNPYLLYQRGSFDQLCRGLTKQPAQAFDRFFVDDVTNLLFTKNDKFGLDLVALNINRGRDHGLPGYNAYRQMCGLSRARDFGGLRNTMSQQSIRRLRKLYKHVDDIDLFVGGVMERPASGAIVGPLFRCIVGDQFWRLKWGDRFFYDLGGRPHSFSPEQLAEIRKSSMSRVLCDNTDAMQHVQVNSFFKPSSSNPIVACKPRRGGRTYIPEMNLGVFAQHGRPVGPQAPTVPRPDPPQPQPPRIPRPDAPRPPTYPALYQSPYQQLGSFGFRGNRRPG